MARNDSSSGARDSDKVKVGYYISEELYDIIESRYHAQRMGIGKLGARISRSEIVEDLIRKGLGLPPQK